MLSTGPGIRALAWPRAWNPARARATGLAVQSRQNSLVVGAAGASPPFDRPCASSRECRAWYRSSEFGRTNPGALRGRVASGADDGRVGPAVGWRRTSTVGRRTVRRCASGDDGQAQLSGHPTSRRRRPAREGRHVRGTGAPVIRGRSTPHPPHARRHAAHAFARPVRQPAPGSPCAARRAAGPQRVRTTRRGGVEVRHGGVRAAHPRAPSGAGARGL